MQAITEQAVSLVIPPVLATPANTMEWGSDEQRFAYELFDRALRANDERAWCIIYHDYQRQVRAWVKAQLRLPVEEATLQTLVDDAFVKMAGTFRRHPEKFTAYPNVAALLGLLRLCAQRVVQDYVTSLQQNVPIIAWDATDEPIAGPAPAESDLWELLAELLHDEKEWQVVTRLLLEADKPRRLYADLTDLFTSVDEINTVRERVKGRLQRNQAFRHYLQACINHEKERKESPCWGNHKHSAVVLD